MKLLIGYASRQGQTRKIARYVADAATDKGHSVELLALSDAEGLKLERFDKVLLAAPIHMGHYPKAFVDFVSDNCGKLNEMTTSFLSVSLSAAGHNADDWKDLDRSLDDLQLATGWGATDIQQVAGAYKPSQYDILTRFIMLRILTKRAPNTNLDEDKEFTDWAALDSWTTNWLTGI
ncbi:MAG: flavodoxin domain-containing protein [Hyphomonas sp.]